MPITIIFINSKCNNHFTSTDTRCRKQNKTLNSSASWTEIPSQLVNPFPFSVPSLKTRGTTMQKKGAENNNFQSFCTSMFHLKTGEGSTCVDECTEPVNYMLHGMQRE